MQAAVNISIVGGKLSPERAKTMSSRGRDIDPNGGQPYSAAALSLVYHPAHPYVPTLRADIRRFQASPHRVTSQLIVGSLVLKAIPSAQSYCLRQGHAMSALASHA